MASTAGGDEQQTRSRRRPGDRQTPPPHHGQIVSHTAGRIRVRLHQELRKDAVLGELQQRLLGQSGVAAVTTNTRTGSVLVRYDHHRLSRADLLACLHDIGVIARDIGGAEEIPEDLALAQGGSEVAPHSSTAASLMDALADLDRRVSDLTGGKLDVKLLFPLGLGVMALRQVSLNGLGLAEVPGYVLLWYAFDSFYKLHQRRTAHIVEAAAEHVMEDHVDRDLPLDHVDDVMIVDETTA
jgi:hypothetical protein